MRVQNSDQVAEADASDDDVVEGSDLGGEARPPPRGGLLHLVGSGGGYAATPMSEEAAEAAEIPAEVDGRPSVSLLVTLCVPGWLRPGDDALGLWGAALPGSLGNADAYVLRWEPKLLEALGRIPTEELWTQVAQSAASWWLQYTIAAVSTAAAGVLTAPLWVVSSLSRLDNTWQVARERARQAGQLLAEALLESALLGAGQCAWWATRLVLV